MTPLDVYTQGGELAKTRHTEQDCEDGAKLGTERDEGAPGQKRLFLRSERGIASCRDDGESELSPRVNGKAPVVPLMKRTILMKRSRRSSSQEAPR
jgi:hypothetical protein